MAHGDAGTCPASSGAAVKSRRTGKAPEHLGHSGDAGGTLWCHCHLMRLTHGNRAHFCVGTAAPGATLGHMFSKSRGVGGEQRTRLPAAQSDVAQSTPLAGPLGGWGGRGRVAQASRGPCGLCVWLLGGERWAEGWGLPPHRPCPACSPSLHSPFPGALCPGVAGAPPAATPNKQQRGSRRERGHASRLLRAQARQLQGNSRPSPWPTPGRQETRGGLCTPGRHSQLRASPWWGRRASRCPLDPGPRKKTPNVLIPFHNSLGTSHLGTNTTHFFLIYSYFSPACPCGEGVSSVRSLFVLSLPPCPPRGTLTGSVQGSGEKAPSPSLPV